MQIEQLNSLNSYNNVKPIKANINKTYEPFQYSFISVNIQATVKLSVIY